MLYIYIFISFLKVAYKIIMSYYWKTLSGLHKTNILCYIYDCFYMFLYYILYIICVYIIYIYILKVYKSKVKEVRC